MIYTMPEKGTRNGTRKAADRRKIKAFARAREALHSPEGQRRMKAYHRRISL